MSLNVLQLGTIINLKSGDVVVATSDFTSKAKGFLAIKKDDIIQVEGPSKSAGWYIGTCEGRKGMFSANYVKLLKENGEVSDGDDVTPPAAPPKTATTVKFATKPTLTGTATAVLATVQPKPEVNKPKEPVPRVPPEPIVEEEEQENSEPVNWEKVFSLKNLFVAGAVMSVFKKYNIGGLGDVDTGNAEESEQQ